MENPKTKIAMLKVGSVFYSHWLRNRETGNAIPIKVVAINETENKITVDYGSGAGYDKWNLAHVNAAFNRFDYRMQSLDAVQWAQLIRLAQLTGL